MNQNMMPGIKEEFKQYQKICESISILSREIRDIEAEAAIVGDTYRDYRSGTGITKNFRGLIDVQRKKDKLEHLIERRNSIILSIDMIHDDITREVIKMRYIDGKTWQQIASDMGHADKADYYRIVVHDKFFREQSRFFNVLPVKEPKVKKRGE